YLKVWHTCVQYHINHALGLFVVDFLTDKLYCIGSVTAAGWLMLAGIVLFSGSLYILSLTHVSILGAITPLGGVAFIISW
ncbi:DUF423 domain-containing protein, partial [Bacillus vallismortis]|nr:DUF423 domain-containing protein [Bacillus vallismortis]